MTIMDILLNVGFISGLLGTLFRWKKVNLFQYLSSMSSVGVKPDAYVIMFIVRWLNRCITIVGLNAVWKLHETWDHDTVIGYLGSYVFIPTEKAYGKFFECAKVE